MKRLIGLCVRVSLVLIFAFLFLRGAVAEEEMGQGQIHGGGGRLTGGGCSCNKGSPAAVQEPSGGDILPPGGGGTIKDPPTKIHSPDSPDLPNLSDPPDSPPLPPLIQVICGDSTLSTPEEGCDDGNLVDGDGCGATCSVENGYTCNDDLPSVCSTICGDGVIKKVEVCDDGVLNGKPNQCNLSCNGITSPTCGNKIVEPAGGEECDGDACCGTDCYWSNRWDEMCWNKGRLK